MKQIALIEDDLVLSDTICDILNSSEVSVTQLFNIQNATNILYEQSFDIIILDVMLPDGDGFIFAKEIRSSGNLTPILFLTSLANASSVKIGFDSGGDDYLKKPFDTAELVARVFNLIRRSFFHSNTNLIAIDSIYSFDPLKEKLIAGNTEIELHSKEIAILKLLLKKRGQTVLYDEIFTNAWNFEDEPTFETLRTHIKNIRHKAKELNIQTVRSFGYRLA